jgi:hypothetical protein
MKTHSVVLDLLQIDGEDRLIETVYWKLHRGANASKNNVIIPHECTKCKSLTNLLAETKHSQFLIRFIFTFWFYCTPIKCHPYALAEIKNSQFLM